MGDGPYMQETVSCEDVSHG